MIFEERDVESDFEFELMAFHKLGQAEGCWTEGLGVVCDWERLGSLELPPFELELLVLLDCGEEIFAQILADEVGFILDFGTGVKIGVPAEAVDFFEFPGFCIQPPALDH